MFLWAVVSVVAELSVSNPYVTHREGFLKWFCARRTEVNTRDGLSVQGAAQSLAHLALAAGKKE